MRWLLACAAVACTSTDGPAPPLAPPPRPPPTAAAPTAGAVVLELFTSQGCSSCPPAERLLRELARDRPDVIALAFHVDYWDDLGWADRFASPAWTARQEAYAGRAADRTYTPALIVDGERDVVGSRRDAVLDAIASARRVPLVPADARLDGDAAVVTAEVPPGSRGVVAVVEDDLATDVTAGENAGAHLLGDRVVRALVPADHPTRVPLDRHWRRDRLGAVVLAAAPDGRVVAATRLALR